MWTLAATAHRGQPPTSISAPGGTWDNDDDGTYVIELLTGEVTDTANNAAAAGALGAFEVTTNVAPIVTTSVTTLSYTEDDPAVVIDPTLSITDVDDTLLEGATVSIGSGFSPGEDELAFTDQLGISGNYDAASGVLTLSGTAPVADYQTVLQSVTFRYDDAPAGGGPPLAVRDASDLPPPITRTTPTTVQYTLTIEEHTAELADGTTYEFWTFGDAVPARCCG